MRTRVPGSRYKRRLKAALRERDGDNCHLCHAPMLFGDPKDPGYATLDHVRPRCEGGSNDIDNLALAHRRCNNLRGRGPIQRTGQA